MDDLCSEDMQKVSVCYCICKFPLPSFCQQHATEHKTKSSAFHFLLPPSASQVITSKDVYMQAKIWLQQLSGNQEILREKFAEFQQCEEQIEAAYQELLQFALDAKLKLKQAFAIAKERLNEAVRKAIYETSTHALENQWTGLDDGLAKLLWYHDQRSLWGYQLYTFQATCVKKSLDAALQVALSFSMQEFANLEIKTPSPEEGIEQLTPQKENEVNRLKADLEIATLAVLTTKQQNELLETQLEETKQKLQATEVLHDDSEQLCSTMEAEIRMFKSLNERLENQLWEMQKSKDEISEKLHELTDPKLQLAMFPKKNSIKIFNIGRHHWEDYNFSVCVGSVWTFTKQNEVFVCGGIDDSHPGDSAYMIKNNEGSCMLPDMLVARDAPGIIYDPSDDAVYVFGGSDKSLDELKSSEKIGLRFSHWELLGDMHVARTYFNPCKYESDVYLCGGIQSSVEIYNIPSNTFALLPDFVLPDSTKCTAVVDSDSIVVVSEESIYRWSLQTKERIYCLQRYHDNPWSNCTPVLVEREIYIGDLYGYKCISLATGALEKEG